MSEINAKVKEAWRDAQCIRLACADAHVVRLADAYVQAEARARMVEHMAENHRRSRELCVQCHKWTLANWVAAVKAELSDKKSEFKDG